MGDVMRWFQLYPGKSESPPTPLSTCILQVLANLNPGFSFSGDGQTLSFLYPSSMHSESGHVQVIFQAVSGSALIGTSPIITLK